MNIWLFFSDNTEIKLNFHDQSFCIAINVLFSGINGLWSPLMFVWFFADGTKCWDYCWDAVNISDLVPIVAKRRGTALSDNTGLCLIQLFPMCLLSNCMLQTQTLSGEYTFQRETAQVGLFFSSFDQLELFSLFSRLRPLSPVVLMLIHVLWVKMVSCDLWPQTMEQISYSALKEKSNTKYSHVAFMFIWDIHNCCNMSLMLYFINLTIFIKKRTQLGTCHN